MNKIVPDKFQEKADITYEHLFRAIYAPVVNLAKELERTLGRERALKIVKGASEKSSVEMVKRQVEERPFRSFDEFKEYWKEVLKTPFWTHTSTLAIEEDEPDRFKFHVTECLWAKTFEELGAPEIGYLVCCQPDYATARVYHPKICMTRTKTLMQGDKYCDPTYVWKE
jgi:hypothetical protein